jgi:histone-lysine N-methyltransferase SUV420H
MGRLTSTALGEYDDFLTDTLIDQVSLFPVTNSTASNCLQVYWLPTRKFGLNYQPSARGIDQVIATLRCSVIEQQDIPTAVSQLLQLDKFTQFITSCSGTKHAFGIHLRKYLNIYLPDCPFEVSITNRFAPKAQDAAIIARNFVKKGQEIKYLQGIKARVDKNEQKAMKHNGQDFSLLKLDIGTYMMLGPASFVNHSRKFNARLSIRGRFIQVIAEEDIEIGQEITINYGEEYFYPGVEVLESSEEEEGIAAERLERHWKLYGREWPLRSG